MTLIFGTVITSCISRYGGYQQIFTSQILPVLRADPGYPFPVQPVQIGTPGALSAVPPPFPAFQGYNELTGGPRDEVDIGSVVLNVGGQVGILKKDLLA